MQSFLNDRQALTFFTRVFWAVIDVGHDIVRVSEALESSRAAEPASGSENITLLARLAWAIRDVGEAVEALGERWEARVFARCAVAGLEPCEVLGSLVDSARRSEA